MTDGGLLKNAACMKLDMSSAVHFIAQAWGLLTLTAIKNLFVKCGFLIGHVTSNDGNAVRVTEVKEDDQLSI
jgi:hypothetical protein